MHSLHRRFFQNVLHCMKFHLRVCICIPCVPSACRGQKRVCGPQETILQIVEPPWASWEQSPSPLQEQQALFTTEPILQAQNTILSKCNLREILLSPCMFLCCLQRVYIFCSTSTSQSGDHMSGLHNLVMLVATRMKSRQTAYLSDYKTQKEKEELRPMPWMTLEWSVWPGARVSSKETQQKSLLTGIAGLNITQYMVLSSQRFCLLN